MRKIKFQSKMNGKIRIAIPKEKVNGYKHTIAYGIHFYKRGNIAFMVDLNNGCTIEKFDYKQGKYISVNYDDFHHFIDIKVITEVKQ